MRYNVFRSALTALVPTAILVGAAAANAACGPSPRPLPMDWSITQSGDGKTTFINTGSSQFPPGNSFGPNPTNLLPTEYTNLCDVNGNEIPNTLPSTPEHPYNLHPDPVVTPIDKTSPTDDLDVLLRHLRKVRGDKPDDRIIPAASPKGHGNGNGHGSGNGNSVDMALVQFGIDVLEGNPLPRVYSGMPILHYNGPLKVKHVTPIKDGNGVTIGGNVVINQIWFDSHIESDTNYIYPGEAANVPWTITYNVNVLNRGHEDFAPYSMWFQGGPTPMPHVGADQTFFPMEEGLRYTYEMKMAPGKYWNLTYHWGWRIHPPRVQVTENAEVLLGGRTRDSFEIDAFGPNPRADEAAKLAAIDMIGELAPSKRMWKALRAIKAGAKGQALRALVTEFEESFDDWQHRNRLPRGVKADPSADQTLLFINDTIYGQVKGYSTENNRDAQREMRKFTKRGDKMKVQLLNGDYFLHGYVLVDFGGLRGWENTFHNTMPIGGAGALFSFGRNHWWMNTTMGPIPIPTAERPQGKPGRRHMLKDLHEEHQDKDGKTASWNKIRKGKMKDWANAEGIGEHFVEVTFNYDPPPRLRMYQFDGFHHDTAIWSLH